MFLKDVELDNTSQAVGGDTASFEDVVSADYNQGRLVGTSTARFTALTQAYDNRANAVSRAIQERYGQQGAAGNLRNPVDVMLNRAIGSSLGGGGPIIERDMVVDPFAEYDKHLKQLSQQYPLAADVIRADRPVSDEARELSVQAGHTAEDVGARSPGGIQGFVASSIGGMGALLRDPVQTLTMMALPEVHVARIGLFGLASQSAVGAGKMAVGNVAAQPIIQDYRRDIGLPHGFGEAAEEVKDTFLSGLLFEGAGRVAIRGAKYGVARARGLDHEGAARAGLWKGDPETLQKAVDGDAKSLREISDANPEDSTLRGAANELEQRDLFGAPPEVDTGEHLDRLSESVRGLYEDDGLPPGDATALYGREHRPAEPRRSFDNDSAATPHIVEGKPVHFRELTPDQLTADPETFQFKSNGDINGETGRLRGVTQWDPLSSGKTMAYERADGSMVIADGHQRLGLAKRLAADGQDPKLASYVFREADGWQPSDVRSYAAMKNLKELSGSPLDMARVMRERPDLVDGSLPLSDGKMREAVGLARLSPDAFGMVVNGVIPEHYAALIGDTVTDASRHADIAADMLRADPANLDQARYTLGQILSLPTAHEHQISLFGDEERLRSLLPERVRVLDSALKALSRDRRVFGLLDREAGLIESAGNQLGDANTATAERAAQMRDLIEKLSTTKGVVSDLLSDAADAVGNRGVKTKTAADAFTRRLGDILDEEGLSGLTRERRVEQPPMLDDALGPEAVKATDALDRASDLKEITKEPKEGETAQEPRAMFPVDKASANITRRQADHILRTLERDGSYTVPRDVVDSTREAFARLENAIPHRLVGALSRVEAMPDGRYRLTYETPTRGEKSFVGKPENLFNMRAFMFPGEGVFFNRISALATENRMIGGEAAHEIVHLVKVEKLFPVDVWNRLLAHANVLNFLDMSEYRFARFVGDPQAEMHSAAARGKRLHDDYTELYAKRAHKAELLDEEAVAHMAEAYVALSADPKYAQQVRDAFGPVMQDLEDLRNGKFTGGHGGGNPMFALPGFFHGPEDAVAKSPQARATPQQWMKLIEGRPGWKDYADWTGLPSFFEGKKSVTRDELLAYMRAHSADLGEKTFGDRPPTPTEMGRFDKPTNAKYETHKVPGGEPGSYRERTIELPGWEYNEPHFGGPVVVHTRTDTRIGSNGERIHFLNEVQATGHQKGRTDGYRSRQMRSENEVLADMQKIVDEINDETDLILNHEYSALQHELDVLSGAVQDIPTAPFKGELWLELSLKRMLRHAVENGYDALSWARSDQIAKAVGTNPEGLRVQYDQKIGKFLDKYTKKWGGKVESTGDLPPPINEALFHAGRDLPSAAKLVDPGSQAFSEINQLYKMLLNHSQQEWSLNSTRPILSKDAMEAVYKSVVENWEDKGNQILRITPEMRDSVMKGQAYAKRGGELKPKQEHEHLVYHGTPSSFDKFDPKRSGYPNNEFYFSDEPSVAAAFAGPMSTSATPNSKYAPRTIPAYIDTSKFKTVDFNGYDWISDDGERLHRVIDSAKKQGYHGLVAKKIIDSDAGHEMSGFPNSRLATQYITWTEGTVRSALSDHQWYAMTDGEARSHVQRRLSAGRPVEIVPGTVSAVQSVHREMQHLVPEGVKIGTISKVEPIAGDYDHYRGIFTAPDGSTFSLPITSDYIWGGRAAYVPQINAILSLRFGGIGESSSAKGREAVPRQVDLGTGSSQPLDPSSRLLKGETAHEIVHSIYARLSTEIRGRLVAHANSLGLLDLSLKQYLTLISDSSAKHTDERGSLRDEYLYAYEGRPNLTDAINEEAAAHFVELATHGHFTEEQIAPVKDILDGIMSGKWAGKEQRSDGLMYALAGQKAKGANADALRNAKQLALRGAKSEQIWKETGWYRGVDGQWRFEIDDAGSSINKRSIEKFDDGNSGFSGPLKDILQHPNLYKVYPELKEVKVYLAMGEGFDMMGSIKDGVIDINIDKTDLPLAKSIIMHEITHWVQEHEGFEIGGSPQGISNTVELALLHGPEYGVHWEDPSGYGDYPVIEKSTGAYTDHYSETGQEFMPSHANQRHTQLHDYDVEQHLIRKGIIDKRGNALPAEDYKLSEAEIAKPNLANKLSQNLRRATKEALKEFAADDYKLADREAQIAKLADPSGGGEGGGNAMFALAPKQGAFQGVIADAELLMADGRHDVRDRLRQGFAPGLGLRLRFLQGGGFPHRPGVDLQGRHGRVPHGLQSAEHALEAQARDQFHDHGPGHGHCPADRFGVGVDPDTLQRPGQLLGSGIRARGLALPLVRRRALDARLGLLHRRAELFRALHGGVGTAVRRCPGFVGLQARQLARCCRESLDRVFVGRDGERFAANRLDPVRGRVGDAVGDHHADRQHPAEPPHVRLDACAFGEANVRPGQHCPGHDHHRRQRDPDPEIEGRPVLPRRVHAIAACGASPGCNDGLQDQGSSSIFVLHCDIFRRVLQ